MDPSRLITSLAFILVAGACGSSDEAVGGGEPGDGTPSAGTGGMAGSGAGAGGTTGSETGGLGAGATTSAAGAGAGAAAAGGSGGTGAGGAGAGSGAAGSGGTDVNPSELIGWAADAACGPQGTTGGGDGPPTVTVTTIDELEAELLSGEPKVIAVSGTISTGGNTRISDIRDKTLVGIDDAEITGGFVIDGANNFVVKNVHFSHGTNDTVELTGSTCIWFDHCAFSDGADGNLDIVRETNYVTVSWSQFFYTQGHNHMFSNLTGNGDDATGDRDKLKVTFHHDWWGAGVRERMPRVRFGQVHIFNNYYAYEPVSGDSGQGYCIAAGFEADLVVENNYFDGSNDPIRYQTNGEGTAEITETGNEYVGTTGATVSTGSAFTPPYPYTLDAGASVKDIVMAGAGPQ